ncbi:MAG TPA: ABC transporter, partial [Planctomycetaceae bacterium]|nr:ABC transporter [Planctomycetaceae bacterium]
HLFLLLFTTSGHFFSLVQFIAFFGPLIGIIMGFDAINREKNEGTLSMLLSQPVNRDAIINGKFLAGLAVIATMVVSIVLLISGLGMVVIGVVPTAEQLARLLLYVVLSIIYIGFWLGLALLFSILFRSIGTSALASIAFWIAVVFFVSFATKIIADVIAPIHATEDVEQVMKHQRIVETINRSSPVYLYTQAANTIMDPYRKTTKTLLLVGPMERISRARFNNPLDLPQSVLIVAPYLITIVALTSICFAAAYLVFMKQEVRSI